MEEKDKEVYENTTNNEVENSDINGEVDIKELKKQYRYQSILDCFLVGCIVCILTSAITYYLTVRNSNQKFISSTLDAKRGADTTTAQGSLNDINNVLSTFAEMVDRKYIGKIDKQKLIDETVKGFINGIGDEYSEYMTAEDWKEYQEKAFGNYSGVGIVMMADDNGYILVSNIIKDSPAEKAGIQKGDYIVGVDGESIYKVDATEVANKVRGEIGTEVTLNIVRDEDTENPIEFKLKRDNIRQYHVETKMLEDDIGYIYLYTFDTGCAAEFETELDKLVEQGAKKLVFDLRYNTGGDVSEALSIADLFLEKEKLEIITTDANGNVEKQYSKNDKKYNFDNVVILMNKYTASASEILSGALLDNNVAKSVGTKSYGKGVMQNVFSLLDGSMLKLTTQEYHTPNDTKINKIGITPNYVVEEDKNSDVDVQLEKAKEVVKGE